MVMIVITTSSSIRVKRFFMVGSFLFQNNGVEFFRILIDADPVRPVKVAFAAGAVVVVDHERETHRVSRPERPEPEFMRGQREDVARKGSPVDDLKRDITQILFGIVGLERLPVRRLSPLPGVSPMVYSVNFARSARLFGFPA